MMEINTETLIASQKKFANSSASEAFVNAIHSANSSGLESAPRGHAVRESFLERLDINPCFPFPDFEARRFNYMYFAGEMAWYLKGDRSPAFINNFSNFWKGLVDADGLINSNYGNLLFYSNQLIWAYQSLVKDRDSRQAISFVSNPSFQYEGNKDFVCTLYLNFWIRKNQLHMKVHMRSNDIFYGFSYDVPFFATVHQTMWHNLKEVYPELELGTYFHMADNIHYYERHFEIAKSILAETPKNPEFVLLKEPLFWIQEDHLVLTQNTLDFQEEINSLLEEGKLSQETCKNALRKLFIIQ